MLNITLNTEKNGIELRFDTKPNTDIITAIKEAGFRWSGKQKIWYAKQNDETVALANQISESEGSFEYKPKTETNIDLWSLTRTEGIEDNYGKTRITNTKEIAANIRKHLRNRFSMCKWSVTSDYNSICVKLLESPFSRNSEALKAIANYAYTYAQSWNYDNSDSMTDYFDVNFYGVYKNDIVNYNYNQRECKPNETELETDFLVKKSEFDAEQKKQEEERIKKGVEEYKIRQAEYKKAEAERQKKIHRIEKNAEIKTVDYTILNCVDTGTSKLNSIADYETEKEYTKHICKVSKEVHFNSDDYELFSKMLLSDFTFIAGTGGTNTDDNRINGWEDYRQMTTEEKESVEFYSVNCVAVYCDNKLKMVIDAQGYGYARYVYLIDDSTKIVDDYRGDIGISDEEYFEYKKLADKLEDVSADIIVKNDWIGTWQTVHFADYKKAIVKWITDNNFKFSVSIVRVIESYNLKNVMYRILTEPDGMQQQFADANLVNGQKITIIRMGAWGGVQNTKAIFKSCEDSKYAQHTDAVKMTFKPDNKNKDYYTYLYNDVIIYNGWLDVPQKLFWEDVKTDSVFIQRTKYASCDRKQYDVILSYFAEHGIKPIINTYKPVF
jgi:hypothetical protein